MMRKLTLHKAILIALLAFLIVYPASPALAGINIWTSQGPEGGSINTLAMHPQSPDNMCL